MKLQALAVVLAFAIAAPAVATPVTGTTYSGTGTWVNFGPQSTWQPQDQITWSFTLGNTASSGPPFFELIDFNFTIGSDVWTLAGFDSSFFYTVPVGGLPPTGADVLYNGFSNNGTFLLTGYSMFDSYLPPSAFLVGNVGAGFSGLDAVGILRTPTNAVPEPASWAMLIAGFGLIGAIARKRRLAAA